MAEADPQFDDLVAQLSLITRPSVVVHDGPTFTPFVVHATKRLLDHSLDFRFIWPHVFMTDERLVASADVEAVAAVVTGATAGVTWSPGNRFVENVNQLVWFSQTS